MPETPHHLIQQQWANCPRTPETPFEQGDHHHDLPNVTFVAVTYDEDEICGQYLNTDLYKCCL